MGSDKKPGKKRGPPKGSGGRKPHKRDEAKAGLISLYMGTGCTQEAVAYQLGISVETMHKYYNAEVAMGKDLNRMFWTRSLAREAGKGSVDAIKFALSRKHGWTETNRIVFGEDDNEEGVIFDGNRAPVPDEDPAE